MASDGTVDISNMACMYGSIRVSGYGPGSPLSITFASARNKVFAGVDGLAVFVKSKDKTARVQIELMPNSVMNAVFSTALAIDDKTPGGLVVPMSFRDKGGTSLFATDASKIEKLPDYVTGDGLNVRVWTLLVGKMRGFVGGMRITPEDTPAAPATLI